MLKSIVSFAFTATLLTGMTCMPVYARDMLYGVNAHDNWQVPTYNAGQAEAVFKLLAQRNLRTYRVDIEANNHGMLTLDRLVPLARKYNILLRPMLYVDKNSEVSAYTVAKRYAADIKIWELGNELNLHAASTYDDSIASMKAARTGVMRASAETKVPLQTTINLTPGVGYWGLDPATKTTYTFVDKAIAAGLQFDYLSYHYYPRKGEREKGLIKQYLDPLRKYGKPVFLNETNCGEIQDGDNGDSAKCVLAAESIQLEVEQNYADMVQEINMYELLDSTQRVGSEGHFGLMFDINKPKATLAMLTKHALDADATYLNTPSPALLAVQGVIKTSANANFVNMMFHNSLNRIPDKGGLVFWTDALDKKRITKAALLKASVTYPEFTQQAALMNSKAFVARLHIALLGRRATMVELNALAKQLDSKALTRDKVIDNIVNSAEFKQRITMI